MENYTLSNEPKQLKWQLSPPKATAQATTMALVNTIFPTDMTKSDPVITFSRIATQIMGPKNTNDTTKWSLLLTLWKQHHQIMAINSISSPLAEALNLTQLTLSTSPS
jgi:hypothetical protein